MLWLEMEQMGVVNASWVQLDIMTESSSPQTK